MAQKPEITKNERSRRLLQMDLRKRTRVLMEHFNIEPRRSLSQNFLMARSVAEKIAGALLQAVSEEAVVVEVGAGLGALTAPLGQSGLDLIAYETDPALIEPLRALTASLPQVQIRHQDFTGVDLQSLEPGRTLAICGNLPYHLSGLLLRRLMEAGTRCDIIAVTVQSEVAERLQAMPGDDAYGILSVFSRYYLQRVEPICDIGPAAFYPAPDVGSTAVAMYPVREAESFVGGRSPNQRPMLFETIKGAFAHRRKTVRNSLALSLPEFSKQEVSHALQRAGVRPSIRAEKLDIEHFSRIADELSATQTERDG